MTSSDKESALLPANGPPPPPDGGLQAWTQVFCMHMTFFNSWGVSNSFGVFQQFYSETLPQSNSDISWIGGVQVSLLFFVGVISGRLTDGGYFRPVYFLGVLLQLVGVFMASLCKNYWQVFLAQAVCMGLGNGCTFCSGLAVMSSYFLRNRALAVGVAAAGAAVGGLIFPVVVDRLLYEDAVGYPWTLRAVGFIMLATQIPCLLFFKPRLPPRRTGPLVDWSAFKELPFVFFTTSMFFNFWGLYFAFFYLGTFARDRIGMSRSSSLDLIMVLNGVGIVGRIVPGMIGDHVTGMLNVLVPFSFAASLLTYCWAAIKTEAGLYVFAVVYGIIAAALQSLFPATATTMSPEMKKTGTRVGMIMSIVGAASLTGPSIQGALINRDDGGYLYGQLFSATSILIGALAGVACRISKSGFVWKAKV
ncbi:MFS general substrate transporter [Aspergillus sclerotiicarbonarius CBS 121057]|uniref:MFS general substrate transporter n=1 Tax=Aspergillus sclerotiicarbonarius (strain CBS 121057 / IBT 28362) TaxID=1448318 RepID=A0A319EU43_ASPSB|nr:MFS general substrate transporter [Aspergillus sclerotiicarbonarius CBS 121057]